MKKILVILLLGLMFFSLGCDKNKDRNEPNDSFNQAKKIKLGKDVKMSIYPKRDIDFFKFNVDDPGMINLEYDINKPTNLKLIVTIYDTDTNVILSGEKIPFKKTLDKGEYFLSIQDDFNDEESKTAFNISFNFSEVDLDKYEPNDKLEEAKVIKADESLNINIFPRGDKEAFKVQSPNAGYLKFSYDERKPMNIKPMLNFYNLDGELLKGPLALPVEIPVSEGDYAFVIFDENNDSESEEMFSLNVEFESVVLDKYEPNNTISEAKEIKLNKSFKLSLFPAGDKDCFKFEVEKNTLVEILKSFEPNKPIIDIKTNVYDREGNLIINNKSVPFEVDLAPGTYFIQFMNKDINGVYPDEINIQINKIR